MPIVFVQFGFCNTNQYYYQNDVEIEGWFVSVEVFDFLRTEDVTDQTITASMYDMHVTNQIFYCFHIIQVDAFGKKKTG